MLEIKIKCVKRKEKKKKNNTLKPKLELYFSSTCGIFDIHMYLCKTIEIYDIQESSSFKTWP